MQQCVKGPEGSYEVHGSWIRVPASGIRVQGGFVPEKMVKNKEFLILFHLRNFFYTFIKIIFLNLGYWNMEQIGKQYSKSLKLQNKIDIFCSKGLRT
jgi:hypothetical protein